MHGKKSRSKKGKCGWRVTGRYVVAFFFWRSLGRRNLVVCYKNFKILFFDTFLFHLILYRHLTPLPPPPPRFPLLTVRRKKIFPITFKLVSGKSTKPVLLIRRLPRVFHRQARQRDETKMRIFSLNGLHKAH